MSRRSFVRWLLVIAASLIGVSAWLTNWLKSKVLAEEEAVFTPLRTVQPESTPKLIDAATVMDTGEPLFSYFILSDLHISLDDPQTSSKLKLAMEDIKNFDSKVEAIVMTGDLTDTGVERDYKELRKILSSYKLPTLHANMGNHDYYTIWLNKNNGWDKDAMPNGKSDAVSRDQFLKFFGYQKPYNEFTANGYTVLLLSQETYVQEKPDVGEGAWYSDEQMKWLKERLAAVYKPDKPTFVMIHQPLPPAGENGGSHQLIRAKEFREILKPYKNVFVFCGHRHQDFTNGTPHYIRETFHFFHNSSVGRPVNRNFQQEAKQRSQGMYVQVYKNKVVLRGREFSDRSFIEEAMWSIDLQQAKA
jgi:3',5'-cyclic AMP phosphodiesterase CpdA